MIHSDLQCWINEKVNTEYKKEKKKQFKMSHIPEEGQRIYWSM